MSEKITSEEIEHGLEIAAEATAGEWVQDGLVQNDAVAILGGLGEGRKIDPGDRRIICEVSYPYGQDVSYEGYLEDEQTDLANMRHISYHHPERLMRLYSELRRLKEIVGE